MARILLEPFSRALVIESPHPSLHDHLTEAAIEATWLDRVPDEDTLVKALRSSGAQVLFKRSQVPVTRRVIEDCPNLHVVQLCCIGDDSVDKVAAAEHGVLVCNDPVSNGRSVVELAIGHMIALSRRLYETDVAMHAHRWDKSSSGRYEVLEKNLGLVGLGNIGRQVARVAAALGMRVSFFDNRLVAQEVGREMGYRCCEDLKELFGSSDIVSIHASARDVFGVDNAGLLDPWLKDLGAERVPDSPRIFLNLARGNLHSADALLDAVKNGAVRRAAVDVYPEEPAPGAPAWVNPYASEPRISCTPHIGAATHEAQPRIARRVAETVANLSRRCALRDCVYAPRARMQLNGDAGKAVLAVVHSTARGTKKAVDDAIYAAEVNNLGSTHQDFEIGLAYDLSLLERPLRPNELDNLVGRAKELARDPGAIRAIRQVVVPAQAT